MELMSCPLTPKSHSLISPLELTRMFDGFTSEGGWGRGRVEEGKGVRGRGEKGRGREQGQKRRVKERTRQEERRVSE